MFFRVGRTRKVHYPQAWTHTLPDKQKPGSRASGFCSSLSQMNVVIISAFELSSYCTVTSHCGPGSHSTLEEATHVFSISFEIRQSLNDSRNYL